MVPSGGYLFSSTSIPHWSTIKKSVAQTIHPFPKQKIVTNLSLDFWGPGPQKLAFSGFPKLTLQFDTSHLDITRNLPCFFLYLKHVNTSLFFHHFCTEVGGGQMGVQDFFPLSLCAGGRGLNFGGSLGIFAWSTQGNLILGGGLMTGPLGD